MDAANRAGDADSSRTSVLTSSLQGSMNFQHSKVMVHQIFFFIFTFRLGHSELIFTNRRSQLKKKQITDYSTTVIHVYRNSSPQTARPLI